MKPFENSLEMNKYLNINLLDKVSLETILKFVCLVTGGTWSRILMVSLVRQQSARSSVRTASHLNVYKDEGMIIC